MKLSGQPGFKFADYRFGSNDNLASDLAQMLYHTLPHPPTPPPPHLQFFACEKKIMSCLGKQLFVYIFQ